MQYNIKRRPSYPSDNQFLDGAKIKTALYCDGSVELYSLNGSPHNEELYGYVFVDDTQNAAQEVFAKHVAWWNILGSTRLTCTSMGITPRGGKFLFCACLQLSGTSLEDRLQKTSKFSVDEAISLFYELSLLALSAKEADVEIQLNPALIWIGNSMGNAIATPLAISMNGQDSLEPAIVSDIGRLVYRMLTGILLESDKIQSNPHGKNKTDVVPSIRRWNPDVDSTLSELLGICYDQDRPTAIRDLKSLHDNLDEYRNSGALLTPPVFNNFLKPAKADIQHGLNKVAGMNVLKGLLLEEVVKPIRDPEPYKKYGLTIPNGILLYGPPGCGKTFIARQLAEELGFHFIELIPSEIASPYIHDSVLKIRDIFASAEERAPTIIFIDEFDALMPSRSELGGHQQYMSAEVNEFLVHLNDCAAKHIFIIAATNEPDKVDSAIKRTGRLDKMIYVAPPDNEARIELLKMYLQGRPLAGNIDYAEVSNKLEGYASSDVKNITDEAARFALKENATGISIEHLWGAIKRNPSSITPEIIAKYSGYVNRGI